MEKTASDYANDIDAKDREIAVAISQKEAVYQEQLNLRRRKIDLDDKMSKVKYLIDKLKIERSLLNHAFWAAKNSGL